MPDNKNNIPVFSLEDCEPVHEKTPGNKSEGMHWVTVRNVTLSHYPRIPLAANSQRVKPLMAQRGEVYKNLKYIFTIITINLIMNTYIKFLTIFLVLQYLLLK